MKPVKITNEGCADLTIITVIPAAPGLCLLKKRDFEDAEGCVPWRWSTVLSWAVESQNLQHLPIVDSGIIGRDYCVFDVSHKVVAIDGNDECIATVGQWIDEVRAKKSRQAHVEAGVNQVAKAYNRAGEQQPR